MSISTALPVLDILVGHDSLRIALLCKLMKERDIQNEGEPVLEPLPPPDAVSKQVEVPATSIYHHHPQAEASASDRRKTLSIMDRRWECS